MNYTINELSSLAKVTKRTLRYYDQIGILSPSYINESGYRIYTSKEVDILQQILFFKEYDISLSDIKEMLEKQAFNQLEILKKHQELLLQKQLRMKTLLSNLEQTINSIERSIPMKNSEKFKGFKENIIKKNGELYGEELKEKYSEAEVSGSYDKIRKMSKKEYKYAEELGQRILQQLVVAVSTNNPSSKEAIALAKMHQEWIQLYWPTYSTKAHKELVQMYVTDERFASYYDKAVQGGASFIRDAVISYLE